MPTPARLTTLLIGQIDILPALFEKVILPAAVRDELSAPKASSVVRGWIAAPPSWIDVRTGNKQPTDPSLSELDPGERAAISPAAEIHADLLLIDDREGVTAAREKGFRVAGTLTVLAMAAKRGLLDLPDAVLLLKRTNFRYRQEMIDSFLARHSRKN